ncbi:alkane 1-monooxygenase [Marinicella sp. W31]|uniref:alkane 1-monooxygenase n=1 Tax=Marinicella sp. W31 TaxID=3023713 RepID=UPI00375754C1
MSETAPYQDKKRYLWILSTLIPLLGLLGIGLYEWTGQAFMVLMPLVIVYVVIPVLDMVFSEDQSNPPESAVPELEKDPYYAWLAYLMLPLYFAVLTYIIYYIDSRELSWWMIASIVWTLGVVTGLTINQGHELGHKKNAVDQNIAKLALASSFYGHFTIEHNAGHHAQVATPEDTASARYGESIYRFALREVTGGIKRAWRLEKKRLQRKGLSVWSLDNQILHSYAMSIVIFVSLTAVFGWTAVWVLLLNVPASWWQLTSANYVEHYGLLRLKDDTGKYERCQPKHSWNSNHLVSNLVLFHLQRHSDHHANPARHYQSLRHFDEAPQLPSGYMGMFVLAYIPPLWRKVMDKRLLNSVNHDMRLVNA